MNSKLQIISGIFRGRKLNLPPEARPTQNRARVALFNILDSGIVDTDDIIRVWDVFAGSGAFGLECLSRYLNASVLFTDVAASSIRTVRDNLKKLNVGERAVVLQADAITSINKFGRDTYLIFVDSPYDKPELGISFVEQIGKIVKNGTILIWEQEKSNFVSANEQVWDVLKDKTYGRARFLFLRKK